MASYSVIDHRTVVRVAECTLFWHCVYWSWVGNTYSAGSRSDL